MRIPDLHLVAHVELSAGHPRRRISTWAPFPIAALLACAALVGIVDPAIYARETPSWAAQGQGQDWIDALVCAPALLACGWFAWLGSRRARVLVAGLLLYTAYSAAIYAVAMHFTALFLVYCAVLGGSVFALVDLVAALRADAPYTWYGERAPLRTVAITLLAIAAVFGVLWLAQIVPALVRGEDPPGLAEVGLAANPVHVLDLALVLPAMVVAGIALLRGEALGRVLAPILLGFGVMMAIAIGGMVAMLRLRGLALDVTPAIAMAVIAAVSLGVLIALLRQMQR
jgi:hypothetical protein